MLNGVILNNSTAFISYILLENLYLLCSISQHLNRQSVLLPPLYKIWNLIYAATAYAL